MEKFNNNNGKRTLDMITPYLGGILLAYSAFLISIMSPGPNVFAIMGTSMAVGRSSGMALAFGIASGSLCWALMTALGLSALIASYAWALSIIKVVGGCYLLWLASKAFRAAATPGNATALPDGVRQKRSSLFLRGFTIQMTNPKAALAWIAVISLGMQADAPNWVAFVVVGGTALLSAIIHSVYALAFSTPAMIGLYRKGRRWIQATLGVFFAFAGVKLLTSRL